MYLYKFTLSSRLEAVPNFYTRFWDSMNRWDKIHRKPWRGHIHLPFVLSFVVFPFLQLSFKWAKWSSFVKTVALLLMLGEYFPWNHGIFLSFLRRYDSFSQKHLHSSRAIEVFFFFSLFYFPYFILFVPLFTICLKGPSNRIYSSNSNISCHHVL